jgi:mono/diheme cytochrome c family protein
MPILPRVLLLAGAGAVAGCGQAPGNSSEPDGPRLFVLANCTTCHGSDGAGGVLGPPLRNLAAHWTRESLAAYLTDPKAVIDADPRMKRLSLNFSMRMPPVTNFTPEQRLAIADHVLKLSADAK